MKSFFKGALLLIVFVIFAFINSPADTTKSKPSITADEISWDFGFVPFDYELVHFYEIKNKGNDNLYITGITTSCDCTYGRVQDTLVPPGGTTKVKATFSTKDYYGKTTRTIRIKSNDPDVPVFEVEFESLIGALPEQVKAEPNALFFLPPHKDKDLKLLNNSGSKIDVTLFMEPDSIFSISETEFEINSGSSATFKVTPRPDLNAGTYHSSFLVDFGTEPNIRVTVPVKIVRY